MTITISGVLPEIVGPDWLMELDAITAMNSGTERGGLELVPGSVVQVSPHRGVLLGVVLAKPVKLAGAGPPLSEFGCDHWAPQKVTGLPTVAFRSPITNDPLASCVTSSPVTVVVPLPGLWVESPPYRAVIVSVRSGDDPPALGVWLTWQPAVPVVAVGLSVQLAPLLNVPGPGLLVKPTEPVGVVLPLVRVSVTVAVQVLDWPTNTVAGAQDTLVDLEVVLVEAELVLVVRAGRVPADPLALSSVLDGG